ncbi:VOC family protein [Arsenicicoccus piscis]|uniref:VOC family protein n=1 Tax=Arsenicicoccus piscis TaxID=673954 RepID=A0ABQ6HUR7_9MICO|nr:VOC family protein [Arsenicicoccus piscis]GMA21781.1 VOC family protein [Arsenicicoccus piscis]
MSAMLNPYLTFNGTARSAMEFYQSIFGGDLAVSTFGDFGNSGPEADKVMHSRLETPSGFVLMGSDTPEGEEPTVGDAITLSLSGDDESLRGYWDKLSEDGRVTMPLEKQMWGDAFGMVTDRFGIGWMVNIGASS